MVAVRQLIFHTFEKRFKHLKLCQQSFFFFFFNEILSRENKATQYRCSFLLYIHVKRINFKFENFQFIFALSYERSNGKKCIIISNYFSFILLFDFFFFLYTNEEWVHQDSRFLKSFLPLADTEDTIKKAGRKTVFHVQTFLIFNQSVREI